MFQENKAHQIFQKTNISYPLIRSVRSLENLACFVVLKHPFWDSPFCFITKEMWILAHFFSFNNYCGNDVRNNWLYISNSNVLIHCTIFFCFTETKHKTLRWKLKTAYLLSLYYFFLVRLLVERKSVNTSLRVTFVNLFNKLDICAWIKQIGYNCWFCSLDIENANWTKTSQSLFLFSSLRKRGIALLHEIDFRVAPTFQI